MNLSREQCDWVVFALRTLITERNLAGRPVRPELVRLHRELAISVSGNELQSDAPSLTDGDDLIDTTAAAAILGCSPRRVCQLHADLDGRKCGRGWIFNSHTVIAYAVAKRNPD